MSTPGNGSEALMKNETLFQSGKAPETYAGPENRITNPPDRLLLTDKERAFAKYLTQQVSDCRGCKVPESLTAEDLSHANEAMQELGAGSFKQGVNVIRDNTKESTNFFTTAKAVSKKVLLVIVTAAVGGGLALVWLGFKTKVTGG